MKVVIFADSVDAGPAAIEQADRKDMWPDSVYGGLTSSHSGVSVSDGRLRSEKSR
jgi:hypothetical protein